MLRRRAVRGSGRNDAPGRNRRHRMPRIWPSAIQRRRWVRLFRRTPRNVQIIVVLIVVATLSFAINWVYQVVRKPSELFFPVSGTLYKTPSETWRQYAPAFRRYSTGLISAEMLAALAQVEGSGNPVVRTYWRWSWKLQPFELYRPASSAVGMYQLTDGTYAEARRYCIHDHEVVQEGAWNEWHSCWFNSLYLRVVPSHAIEMTSAYLDRAVAGTLARHRLTAATLAQKQDLAAVIHLCGTGAGDVFARRHFRLTEGQRCGDHEVRGYVARVSAMTSLFAGLAAAEDP
jgi:hypothetical protein